MNVSQFTAQFKKNKSILLGLFFTALLCIVGVASHVFTGEAANSANYANNGAASGRFAANATSVLVLDITIPDAWNGSSSVADIEKKGGSASYWQGDALNDFTALGDISGIGYKEDGTVGFQGTEPVVIDFDGDKSYTTQKDNLVDADGTVTTEAGTDATPVGTLLLPMTPGIAAQAHSVCTNSTSTPTAVRIDSGGGCANAGGVGSAGTYLIGSGASAIEVDTTWGFYDADGDGIFDDGEALYRINLAPRLVSTATLVDADGSATTGVGTTTSTVGTLLKPFRHTVATGNKNVCVDSLTTVTTLRINTAGNCNGSGGTYLLGSSATVAQTELTGRYSYVDDNNNGTFDAGEDIFKQSISGTYSGSGDTDVYNTGGLFSGDALTDFPAGDCDGAGSGTKKCRFTGSGTIASSSSILVDEGAQGGAAPNGVVDKQTDQLIGLGVQNTGTAVNGIDISAVKVWIENGSSTGFQANQDIILGTMTVNSGNNKEWRLGGLARAISTNGERIYVTVDVAANPTNNSTLQFQLPLYNDAGSNNAVTADNDRGIFVSSNNDGPTDAVVVNANTETIDTQSPSVTLSSAASSTTNISPIRVTATFDENVSDFALDDIVVTNGTTSNFASSSASAYTFDVTPSGQGTVAVNISPGAAVDSAGNSSNAASQLSRVYDSVAPTITLSTAATTSTNASPIRVTATFSENISGFTSDDVMPGNGTVSNFTSSSAAVYAFDVTPSGQGAVTIDIASGAAQDVAGNDNAAAAQLSRTYDTVRPEVTLSSAVAGTTDVSPTIITATFTENVSGFTALDIQVVNGTADNVVAQSSSTYTFEVAPLANGTLTVGIPAGGASDAAGNTNLASPNEITWNFNSPKPTVSLSSTAPNSTNVSPIPVAATFSKAVHGFTSEDVLVDGGAITGGSFASSSDTVYTFTVAPSGQGTVTVSIPADTVIDDTDTYTNFASPDLVRIYDSVAPTVTLSSTASSTTNVSPIHVTATFSEDVINFISSDVVVGNGAISNFASSSASVYTFDVTPSEQGVVTVDVTSGAAQDAAGNENTDATQLVRTYHTEPPTFGIQYYSDSSLLISLGNNPHLKAGTYYLKVSANEILLAPPTVTIDAEGTGNDIVDAATSLVSGSDYTYTRAIATDTLATGSVLEDISITGTDSAGNIATNADPTNESSKAAYTDTVRPTVVITSTASSTTKNSPIPFTATFSEAVTGFGVGDITVGNGSAGSFASTSVSIYAFSITPSGQGSVSVDIASGGAQDAAGNGNVAASQLIRTYDSAAPILTAGDSIGTTTSTTPSYTFHSDSDGSVTYGGDCSSATTDIASGNITLTFNVLSAGAHNCTITVTDIAGNSTTLTIPTFTVAAADTTPPVISDIAITPSSTTALVEWTTNEPASTQVRYGLMSLSVLTTSETDASPGTLFHSATLSNLVSCATYHYRVLSKDSAANQSSSTESTFSTKGCAGNSNVAAQRIGTFNYGSGGTLSLLTSALGILLDIPPEFSNQNAEFQIKKLYKTVSLNALSIPSGYQAVGDYVYDLNSLPDAETAISSFDNALTITLTYADADIAEIDEASLVIFRNDGGVWAALSNCSVDAPANSITCDTDGFSTFSLFGKASSSTSTSTTSSTWVIVGSKVVDWTKHEPQSSSTAGSSAGSSSTSKNPVAPYQFMRDLKKGMSGSDVKRLQIFLNTHGFSIGKSNAGSPGKETNFFGEATVASLKRFQEAHFKEILAPQGLLRGTGLFFFYSRKVVNAILSAELSGR